MIRVRAFIVLSCIGTVQGFINGTSGIQVNATVQHTNTTSNTSVALKKLKEDDSDNPPSVLPKEDTASFFFSKAFADSIDEWNNTLRKTSAKCAKMSSDKSGIALAVNFPVFTSIRQCNFNQYETFLPVIDLEPVLVRRKGKTTLVHVASLALLELSPLLVLCLSCATLAGMIIWALDTRANPGHFPKRFWRGIFDGMWWALVTMTTVGYGDKAPKSFLARLFATIWMIAGIILLSMFTAQVSSRLTTEELKNDDHIYGKKIGVPQGFELSDYVKDVMKNAVIEEYQSTSDYVEALKNNVWDSALVFHCDDSQVDTSFEVVQFLEFCQVGAVVYIDLEYDSSDDWGPENQARYMNCVKPRTRKIRNQAQRISHFRQANHHSCKKLFRQQEENAFSFKWVYFKDFAEYLIPLGAIIGAILFASLLGGIYECCQKDKRGMEGEDLTGSTAITSIRRSPNEKEELMSNLRPKGEKQTV